MSFNCILQLDAIVGIVVVTLVEMKILGLVGPCKLLNRLSIPYSTFLELSVNTLFQVPFLLSVQASIRVNL